MSYAVDSIGFRLGTRRGTPIHTSADMAREPYFSCYPCPENPQAFHDHGGKCRARGLRDLHYLIHASRYGKDLPLWGNISDYFGDPPCSC